MQKLDVKIVNSQDIAAKNVWKNTNFNIECYVIKLNDCNNIFQYWLILLLFNSIYLI